MFLFNAVEEAGLPPGFFVPAIQALGVSDASVVAFCFHTKRSKETGHMREEIDHYREWSSALDFCEKYLKDNQEQRDARDPQRQEVRMALGLYKLRCFAIRLRNDPRSTWAMLTNGMALRLYLINKHHWTPAEAMAATGTELEVLYLLHDELLDLKLNEQEAYPPKQWAHRFGRRSDLYQHFEQPD